MNIINTVTLKSLKKNKTRTFVTIIGIMLSAAMICAVTISISSFADFGLRNMIANHGSWHGMIYAAPAQTAKEITARDEISTSTYYESFGYTPIESGDSDKPYLYIAAIADNFTEMLPLTVTAGRLPENSSEIMIPDHLAEYNGKRFVLGESVTFETGSRFDEDGNRLDQNTHLQFNYNDNSEITETFVPETSRTYTVVGFCARPDLEPYAAPGYTAITVSDAGAFADNVYYNLYFSVKDTGAVYDFVREIGGTTGLSGDYNTDVLMFMGVSGYDSFYAVFYSLGAILMALIMFGSVSLIYNAFSISVSQRTRQFGLLSSVGATRKQLRHSVLFEAFTVAAVGIPLGIFVGIAGIGITLTLIGDKFSSLGSFSLPMRLFVSPLSIVLAVVIALVTILISAWIPSRRAMKVSAVEAIRQSGDVKISAKKIRTSKLTAKLFGLSGMLASKQYKRSRKGYRATVLSLFMSIVLFVSAASFTGYLKESVSGTFNTPEYDITFTNMPERNLNEVSTDSLKEIFTSAESVENCAYMTSDSANAEIAADLISKDAASYFTKTESGYIVNPPIMFVDDAEFDKLLEEYGFNKADYYNTDAPLALMYDCARYFNSTLGKIVTVDIVKGSDVTLSSYKYKEFEEYYSFFEEQEDGSCVVQFYDRETDDHAMTLPLSEAREKIGELHCRGEISHGTVYLYEGGGFTVLYPYSMLPYVPLTGESDTQTAFYLSSSDHKATYADIKTKLASQGIDTTQLYDVAERYEDMRNIVTIINVFSYGFIVLISLIAAANVFNTISTNINLRRREFAMLKSVGMTSHGFNSMMNYECLLYGTKALMSGLPVSVLVTFLIYLSVNNGYMANFRLPWYAIGISVFSVFLVVFATMMYSMRKIKADNPIDALKNENI